MILCIEVYPAPEDGTGFVLTGGSSSSSVTIGSASNTNNHASTTELSPPQPIVVQYVSLVSTVTSNNEQGIVWSIGRRSGSYHLSTDKTVSREHCRIKIGTTVASRVNGTARGEEVGIRPFLVDSNTAEAYKECHESKDKLCILIENIGKLGTYIINECHQDTNVKLPSSRPKTNDNGSDSETDDEMDVMIRTQQQQQSMQQAVVSQHAGIGPTPPTPLSVVTESLLRSSQQKVRSIDSIMNGNETKVVSILTLRDDDESSTNQQPQNRRCIIQIGKSGSTIVIRRMPSFQFIPSGVAAKRALELYQNQLYKIGCYIDDPANEINHRVNIHHIRTQQNYRIMPWNKNNMTGTSNENLINFMRNEYGACTDICYIILTTQYTASLKQLIAWTTGIPIVTPTFLEGLLHHTITALPSVADYQPESDTNTFWSYPTTLRPNPQLWKNYTLLSLPKKKKPSMKQYENDYDLEQLLISAGVTVVPIEGSGTNEDAGVLEQVRTALNRGVGKNGGYFIIGPEANMKKTSASNTTYYYENLVTSTFPQQITSVTPKQIAKYITTQSPLFAISEQPIPQQVTKDEQKVPIHQQPSTTPSAASIPDNNIDQSDAPSATKGNSSMDIDISTNDTKSNVRIKAEVPNTPISSSHRTEIESTKVIESNHDENIPSSMSFTSNNATKHNLSHPTDFNPAGRGFTNSTNTDNEKLNDPNPKGATNSRSNNNTTKNGWIQALPKKRKGHSVEEIRSKFNAAGTDDPEYEIRNVALTEHVKGLIVRKPSENQQEEASSVLRTRTNVPNFKAFRKNTIIAVSVSDIAKSKIRLRSVLPKESDNRRNREEQQQELEEQQRRADELFGDTNTKATSQRRRR